METSSKQPLQIKEGQEGGQSERHDTHKKDEIGGTEMREGQNRSSEKKGREGRGKKDKKIKHKMR